MNIYQEKGFESRGDYLIDLANQYGVPHDVIIELAILLGKDEDFDGLVSTIQDMPL